MSQESLLIAESFSAAPASAQWDVAALALDSGREHSWSREVEHQEIDAASINKLAVVYAAGQKGRLGNFGAELTLEESHIRAGNGVLKAFPPGTKLPLGEVVHQLLSRSDNTANIMLARYIGGAAAINEVLADEKSGLSTTRLQLLGGNDRDALFYMGKTTAPEAAELLRRALRNPDLAYSLRHGHYMGGIRAKIDRKPLLEAHVQDIIATAFHRSGRTPSVRVRNWLLMEQSRRSLYPNKEGRLEGLRHDVALVGETVLAVMYHDEAPEKGSARKQEASAKKVGVAAQQRLGRQVYIHEARGIRGAMSVWLVD